MGCQMLAALDYPSGRGSHHLESVPAWFETWEACLSRFRPDSELNWLNNTSGSFVQVSNILWSVLQAASAAEKLSDGLVTPTQLLELVSAGYDRSFEQLLPTRESQPAAAHRWTSLESVDLEPASRRLRMPPGMQLDFGGIAKGWAAHQTLKRLQAYGPALVDAGGDIAISGLQLDGEPWPVAIQDPRHPEESLGTLLLGRCGVATSGIDYRRWQKNGVWQHHIIDPRSGEPARTDLLSVTVIAPNVLEAETAAKIVLILGSQPGLAWLENRSGFAGLLVTQSGQMIHSHRFHSFLEA